MAKDKTNKERLICIEGMVTQVLNWQSNHMEHHKKLYDRLFKIFLVCLGAALAAGTTVTLALVL